MCSIGQCNGINNNNNNAAVRCKMMPTFAMLTANEKRAALELFKFKLKLRLKAKIIIDKRAKRNEPTECGKRNYERRTRTHRKILS